MTERDTNTNSPIHVPITSLFPVLMGVNGTVHTNGPTQFMHQNCVAAVSDAVRRVEKRGRVAWVSL